MDVSIICTQLALGEITYSTNNSHAKLRDAVWHAYDNKYVHDGRGGTYQPWAEGEQPSGYVEGVVVEGSTTSRLFHVTQTTAWTPGTTYTIDYVSYAKAQAALRSQHLDLHTCD